MLKKNLAEKNNDMNCFVFLQQEALIRKILAKPFKVPLPNYQGKS